jgi:hypothetical protein
VTPERPLAELESLAARLAVTLRKETSLGAGLGDAKGGLCWVRGKPLVVVDASLPVVEQIGVMAKAMAGFDLDGVFVPPLVRARIDRERGGRDTSGRDARGKKTTDPIRPGIARTKPAGK